MPRRIPLIFASLLLVCSICWVALHRREALARVVGRPDSGGGAESSAAADTGSPAAAASGSRPAQASAVPASESRVLGRGGQVTLTDIPQGRFGDELARLSERDRRHALGKLTALKVPVLDVNSLHAMRGGNLFYACEGTPRTVAHGKAGEPQAAKAAQVAADTASAGETHAPAALTASVPISAPPLHHSRPGASKVIYLDFNGQDIRGTDWNVYTGSPVLYCRPYSTDADETTFNAAEQANIVEIWERVAEDYRPFDVDVTTEEPAVMTNQVVRALVTQSLGNNGVRNPEGTTSSGVAFVNVFGDDDFATASNPAFIYYDGSNPATIADIVSHEVGHTMGLSHDGTNTEEYYEGSGEGELSWGPIMGAPLNRNFTQWSIGEYYNANNHQDDIGIIAGKLGFRPDDHAETIAGATLLTGADATNLAATGIIGRSGDTDVFKFSTTYPTIIARLDPYRVAGSYSGGDLNAVLELLDASGAVLATSGRSGLIFCDLHRALASGTYYLRVTGTGAGTPTGNGYTTYGTLGSYNLSVQLRAGVSPARTVAKPGDALVLTAVTGGPAPMSYQWRKNGQVIPGATAAAYRLASLRQGDEGAYSVDLTDSAGAVVRATGFVLMPPTTTGVLTWPSSTTTGYASGAITVAARNDHALAVRADGTVGEWGNVPDDPTNWRSIQRDIVAVAAGAGFSLALRSDGTVMAWGGNASYQGDVPDDLTGVIAVAAGTNHSLALKADGTVIAWGDNLRGQTTIPSGLGGVVAIAAGDRLSMALKADGTVVAWGSNDSGQTTVPAGLANVVAISAGTTHAMALKSDGTVADWGTRSAGNLQDPMVVPPGIANVVAITAGTNYSLVALADGSVTGWGSDDAKDAISPSFRIANVVALAAGQPNFAVALRDATGGGLPVITQQPADVLVAENSPAAFTVAATASRSKVTYQWRHEGSNISGATQATLTIAVATSADEGRYDVVISSDTGSTISRAALLTLSTLPVIESHSDARQMVRIGQPLVLSVSAAGMGPLTYQWYHNSKKIPGATAATYNVPAATMADAGAYFVQVTDQRGMRWSLVMYVLVAPVATEVVTWGNNVLGQLNIPANLSDVVRVASADFMNVALKADGRVQVWGTAISDKASATIQALTDVVAIDGGGGTAVALRSDGSLTVWKASESLPATLIPGPGDIISISVRDSVILALTAKGKVWGWSLETATKSVPFLIPADQPDLAQIFAGGNSVLGLRADGTVVAWGNNGDGQGNIPAGLSGVLAVSSTQGGSISLALKSDGTVAQWGYRPRLNPTYFDQPANMGGVASLTHGLVALRYDGTVVRWGVDSTGLLTVPTGLTDVIAVECGHSHIVALRDATRDPLPGIVTQPVGGDVTEDTLVTLSATIEAGPSHPTYQWYKDGVAMAGATGPTLALGRVKATNTGSYTLQVTNAKGTVTSAAAQLVVETIPVISSQSPARQVIPAGWPLTLSVTATGSSSLGYQWYRNGRALAGATAATYLVPEAATADSGIYYVVVSDQIGARRSRLMAVRVDPTDTQVVAWGANESGQTLVPSDLDRVVSVSASISHVLALTADGGVRAWGSNFTSQTNVPSGLTDIFAVSAGWGYSLALKKDGTVISWGQLNGSWKNDMPTGLTDVVAISADTSNFLAVRADGTVVVWGHNTDSANTITRTDLNNVIAVTAAQYASLALTTNGTIQTWGSSSAVANLTQPSGISDFVGVSVGDSFAVGLRAGGTPVVWGNSYSVADMAVPAGLADAVRISAGFQHVLALKMDGTVVAWGRNVYGQTTVPAGLKNVYQISAGGYFSLALRDVSVPKAPAITLSPADQTIWAGQSVTLRAQASGSPAPMYQWQKDGVSIPGATAATLTLSAAQTADGGTYRVLAVNKLGNATSSAATLMVRPPGARGTYFGTFASGGRWALDVRADNTATYIAHLPSRQSAIVANFTVNADGSFTIPGTEIKSAPAETVRSLALAGPEVPVTLTAAAAYPYNLTGQIGATGSVSGQLTGLSEIFTGAADATPGSAQASAGYYTASALGTVAGTTYAIVSPSGQALVITTGASVDSASGTVNSAGQLTAATAANSTLSLVIDSAQQTVAATLTPQGSGIPITYAGLADTVASTVRVVNLSVRTPAGTGSQTLIIGFVISGSGTKSLLLRGIGPALGTQGVAAPLADPSMRLLDLAGAELAANDDWGGGATLSQQFAAVGAFALPAGSKDAAIFRALSPGVYSYHTFPAGAGTGVVLGEAYDADDGSSTATVVNMSARTQVGTGENILIAGFVITGNAPKTLLIRGLGPTLVGQGVTGALADPQLYLFGKEGPIVSNDNWGGTAALKTAFATVGAGPLAADNSKDAALLVTLMPGVYSAQVSGVGGTTGVGLVEIFLMP